MLFGRLHIAFGKREWEVRGTGPNHVDNFSGDPYLTWGEAKAAAHIWAGYDFFEWVWVCNVKTGACYFSKARLAAKLRRV